MCYNVFGRECTLFYKKIIIENGGLKMGISSDLFLEKQFDDLVDSMSNDFDDIAYDFDDNVAYDFQETRSDEFDDYLLYDPIIKKARKRENTEFHIKAVGVTYGNRQSTIKTLNVGDTLYFSPQKNNPYDECAILIVTDTGKDIGYVSKDYNREIFCNIKKGIDYKLVVSNITGNYYQDNLGVNIKVSVLNNPRSVTTESYSIGTDFMIDGNVLEKYIGDSKTVVIPDKVTVIGRGAFDGCDFIEQVVLPQKLKKIKTSAFRKCKSLKEINFPNNLQSIGMLAFGLCDSLTKVCIPESVTTIGERVFYNCKNLARVEILSEMADVGSQPFLNCNNLKTIIFSEEIKDYFCKQGRCTKCGGALLGYVFKECQDCKSAGRY